MSASAGDLVAQQRAWSKYPGRDFEGATLR
jgi:hypothetical protein